jgi:hypothetical protein
MMEHFMVNDIFDHKARDSRAVEHRMNPYDFIIRAEAPQTNGPWPTASFMHSPGDGTNESSSEISCVKSLEIDSQIHMPSLRMEARESWLYRGLGRPDLLFVTLDEGS